MNLIYSEFKRKFSLSMYKNLKINLGRMSFLKDFINDTFGNLYPIMQKSDDCTERIEKNSYVVHKGNVERLVCQFFPYATYEITFRAEAGEVGFSFKLPDVKARITVKQEKLVYSCAGNEESIEFPESIKESSTIIISCRPGAFDVYRKQNGVLKFLHTFYEERFKESNHCDSFSNGYVFLYVNGSAVIKEVLSYVDNGISIADIKAIKYENGDVIIENGKMYLTASVRMQEGTFQGVFSWIPGTMEFEFTGALFFDCGDDVWRNYVASAIVYHRGENKWLIWTSAFEHVKVLAHAAFEGDPRFGVNIVDVKIMEMAPAGADISVFAAIRCDEDPDFFYDTEKQKWIMAICRKNPETRKYSYVFFESNEPMSGYTYIGRGYDGDETGGSFVKVRGELFFVCGNDFDKTSEYRIYNKDGMKIASFNYPDGGFRGWGNVFTVKTGGRERCFWLTFDRHNGTSYNWSYGNIYCFETNGFA